MNDNETVREKRNRGCISIRSCCFISQKNIGSKWINFIRNCNTISLEVDDNIYSIWNRILSKSSLTLTQLEKERKLSNALCILAPWTEGILGSRRWSRIKPITSVSILLWKDIISHQDSLPLYERKTISPQNVCGRRIVNLLLFS